MKQAERKTAERDPLLMAKAQPETYVRSADIDLERGRSLPRAVPVDSTKRAKQRASDLDRVDNIGHVGRVRSNPRANSLIKCCKIFAIVVLGLGFLALFAELMWLSIKHADRHDNTEQEHCGNQLSLYLFASSIGGVAWTVVLVVTAVVYNNCGEKCEARCEALHFNICVRVWAVLTIAAWQIIGSIWVYTREDPQHTCPKELYEFCWYFLTIFWSVSGFALLVLCMGVCGLIVSYACFK